jgi:hypothetical protein
MKPLAALVAAALLAAAPVHSAQAAEESGWVWVNAPYLWMSSVTTDLREDAPPVGSTTTFSDVISKLDWAMQLHVEGQGNRFGVFGDVTYLALSDNREFAGVDTNASMDTTLVEVAGVWNVSPERYEGLDVFAGLRHIVADVSVDFDPTAPALPDATVGIDQSLSDFMVGVRYTAPLSERWKLMTRLDGSWGDTDGTVNASILLAYETAKKGSWVFGYRYMDLELGNGERDVDVTMHGPMVAYAFGFH